MKIMIVSGCIFMFQQLSFYIQLNCEFLFRNKIYNGPRVETFVKKVNISTGILISLLTLYILVVSKTRRRKFSILCLNFNSQLVFVQENTNLIMVSGKWFLILAIYDLLPIFPPTISQNMPFRSNLNSISQFCDNIIIYMGCLLVVTIRYNNTSCFQIIYTKKNQHICLVQ